MSKRQDVYNEIDDLSSALISMRYFNEPDNSSKWNHRDIEYNPAGVPVLRLYVGETKKVYKKIFINDVETDLDFTTKITTNNVSFGDSVNSGFVCRIKSNTNEDWITVTALDIGSYKIPINITGELDSNKYANINDNELLVIVEPDPTIVRLEWGYENPLIVDELTEIDIAITAIHSNGQSFPITNNVMRQLYFSSANSHAVIVKTHSNGDYYIKTNNLDECTQVILHEDSVENLMGNDVEVPEPLTVITIKDVTADLLQSAEFSVEYLKEIPMLDINSNYNVTIYGVYKLSNGKVLRYNIDDAYVFSSDDTAIVNTNVNNNTLYPKGLGTTTVTANAKNADDETSVIPTTISWTVRVIKNLSSIDWSIDKTDIHIGIDEATVSVIATYTDGTTEDISNSCSFDYNDEYIKIEGNKIIPIAPGTTDISILSSFETGNIDSTKTYTLNVIQPITELDIIDIEKIVLDDTELELYVGDEKDLTYTICPENATPQPMVWNSTDESVVSVDNNGHVKVLKEGYAKIYVGVKSKETEIIGDYDSTEENIESIYSGVHATCSINALVIKVTGIKLSSYDTTLYVGDDENFYYDVTVEPEQASNKEVKVKFESDSRNWCVDVGVSDYFLTPAREGTGTLRVTSVDNPEVVAEMKVTVIDNRVKKVTINPGNDSDYEWYDDHVNSPEVKAYESYDEKVFNERTYKIDKVEKHERWDDDDFPRYYCPINNSLQLSANIEPSGARFADLKWYSSDGNLVQCTDSGIITPLRRGSQKLDMDAEDDVNDEGRRFPNTTWVTAFNKKGAKSGVCQVRVTRNNITAINIGEVTERDYDEDIFDADGDLNVESPSKHEYRQDYILWRGETKIMPVTLSVQDPNFGPSNNIEWYGNTDVGGAKWDSIVDMNNAYVSRANTNDDFDWTSNTPAQVNSDKKNLDVELNAVGLGKVHFYASCSDKYWSSAETASGITNELGEVTVGDYKVYVAFSSDAYMAQGVPNTSVTLNAANQIIVTTPVIYYIDDDGKEKEFFVKRLYTENCKRVEVKITKNGTPVEGMTTFINSYRSASKINEIVDKTNSSGYAYNPSPNADEYGNTKVSSYVGDDAKPGQGEYKSVEKSRTVRVTVVDAPKDIRLTFKSMSRVMTKDLPHYNLAPVWPPTTRVKIKSSTKRCVPCFIYFPEDFVELLNEYADGDECPIDDKYLSFAWFTSDPNVFIPIERSQVEDDRDAPEIQEMFGNTVVSNGNYSTRTKEFNLKGYGRYMCIQPTGIGKATLTIVNIMSGQSWERLIEVVD